MQCNQCKKALAKPYVLCICKHCDRPFEACLSCPVYDCARCSEVHARYALIRRAQNDKQTQIAKEQKEQGMGYFLDRLHEKTS